VSVPDAQLQRIADMLRVATDASRTTIRGPAQRDGDDTDTTELLAESLAEGVVTMHSAPVSGAAIAEAGTYVYLLERLDVLVQPDCAVGPRPPESLTGFFDVRAQMLGPLVERGRMIGTVSVHQQGATREWSGDDVAALRAAVQDVLAHWGIQP
jgi:GAF domain-containing protein